MDRLSELARIKRITDSGITDTDDAYEVAPKDTNTKEGK